LSVLKLDDVLDQSLKEQVVKFIVVYGSFGEWNTAIDYLRHDKKSLSKFVEPAIMKRDNIFIIRLYEKTKVDKLEIFLLKNGNDEELEIAYKMHSDIVFIDKLMHGKSQDELEKIYIDLQEKGDNDAMFVNGEDGYSIFRVKITDIAKLIAKNSDDLSIQIAFGKTPSYTNEKIILAKGLVSKCEDNDIIEAIQEIERDDEEVWGVFIEAIKKTSRVDLLLNWYLNLYNERSEK